MHCIRQIVRTFVDGEEVKNSAAVKHGNKRPRRAFDKLSRG